MKIILSPAKTLAFAENKTNETTTPRFDKEALRILEKLRKKTVEELMMFYKIKEKPAQTLYEKYQSPPAEQRAIDTYSGIVFQQIKPEHWNRKQYEFALDNTYILDALYGALKLHDGITSYRLDMGHSKILESGTLNAQWSHAFVDVFESENLIINLASNEFSKLIPAENMVTIAFLDWRDEKYKAVNTYVKMARGAFYQEVIVNEVQSKEELKKISVMDYCYDAKLSDDSNFVFVR